MNHENVLMMMRMTSMAITQMVSVKGDNDDYSVLVMSLMIFKACNNVEF
jgi:hypothetical protein